MKSGAITIDQKVSGKSDSGRMDSFPQPKRIQRISTCGRKRCLHFSLKRRFRIRQSGFLPFACFIGAIAGITLLCSHWIVMKCLELDSVKCSRWSHNVAGKMDESIGDRKEGIEIFLAKRDSLPSVENGFFSKEL